MLPALEAAELVAALDAFMAIARRDHPAESARADDERRANDQRLAAWRASRGLAFSDLVRCAVAHADKGHALGDDRYLVHVVARNGVLTLLDGTPIPPAAGTTPCCTTTTSGCAVGRTAP